MVLPLPRLIAVTAATMLIAPAMVQASSVRAAGT